MKKFVRGVVVISALASGLVLSAQTADEIVGKYLDAIGGKAVISQVNSISIDASLLVMGNEAPDTIVIVNGVGYKSVADFNGSSIISCLSDKGGWTQNPMAGAPDPTPMPDDQYKSGRDQIYVEELLDYAARGGKVELVSKDADTYKIKLTTKDNAETTYVIDAKTFLPKSAMRKGKMQDQDVDVTTSFSDYRKTETGLLFPYALDIDLGGQFSLTINVKKLETNKAIDPAIFAMPVAAPVTAKPADAAKPADTAKPADAAKPDAAQPKPN